MQVLGPGHVVNESSVVTEFQVWVWAWLLLMSRVDMALSFAENPVKTQGYGEVLGHSRMQELWQSI